MESLQDIKNEYAQEQGYADWDDLLRLNILIVNAKKEYQLDKHYTEICIRAQKAALETAAENLIWMQNIELQESITNENNLIR